MKEFKFVMSYTMSEIEEHTEGMAHLTMPDDSMKPRIRRGDMVIYDTHLKEIYPEPTPLVVKLNGRTLVREAIQDMDGVITLRSCSRKVEPITVEDGDDLVIVGRVYGMKSRNKLTPYPQPKRAINDDPMGFGKSGADAYDSLPPVGPSPDDAPLSEEARYLMSIDPAMYAIAKYIRDTPEERIERFEMPDESMMRFLSPGDVLLCDNALKEPDPNFALLFVVKIGGEATVREVWRDLHGQIRIRPHNRSFPSYIIEDGDDFEIVGKLIAVTELSLKYDATGKAYDNIKFKLLPSPRKLSVLG